MKKAFENRHTRGMEIVSLGRVLGGKTLHLIPEVGAAKP